MAKKDKPVRKPDVTGEYVTQRRLEFADWPIDWVEITDDINTGAVIIHAASGQEAVTLLPTLADAKEMHTMMGAAIAAAERTQGRMTDHQAAVCFMVSTNSESATVNQESVHKTALPKSDLDASVRCLMCRLEGHQVGLGV